MENNVINDQGLIRQLNQNRMGHIMKSFVNNNDIKKSDDEKEEKLEGGKAEDMSWQDIAKYHDVKLKDLMEQVAYGIKVEKEHTDDEDKIEEIVKDHLMEDPKYYTNKKEKGWGKKEAKEVEEKEEEEDNEVEKSIEENDTRTSIEKAFDILNNPIFEKGTKGEGSRGGKIIGHTKTGKPIYEKDDVKVEKENKFKDMPKEKVDAITEKVVSDFLEGKNQIGNNIKDLPEGNEKKAIIKKLKKVAKDNNGVLTPESVRWSLGKEDIEYMAKIGEKKKKAEEKESKIPSYLKK